MKVFLSIAISLLLIPLVVLSQNTTITSFSKSKKQLEKSVKIIQSLSVVVVPSKARLLTSLHVDTSQRRITKEQIVLNGSMLSQHMCLESSFLNGQSGTQNVSRRMERNTKDEGVQVRSIRNSREWKQICTTSFQQLVKLMD